MIDGIDSVENVAVAALNTPVIVLLALGMVLMAVMAVSLAYFLAKAILKQSSTDNEQMRMFNEALSTVSEDSRQLRDTNDKLHVANDMNVQTSREIRNDFRVMTDFLQNLNATVNAGFTQSAASMRQLDDRLTTHDDSVTTIAQTVIDANEAAMIAHEERMIAALESMERRLVQCVDDKLKEPLYKDLLSELKQIKEIIKTGQAEPDVPPPDPPARL